MARARQRFTKDGKTYEKQVGGKERWVNIDNPQDTLSKRRGYEEAGRPLGPARRKGPSAVGTEDYYEYGKEGKEVTSIRPMAKVLRDHPDSDLFQVSMRAEWYESKRKNQPPVRWITGTVTREDLEDWLKEGIDAVELGRRVYGGEEPVHGGIQQWAIRPLS